MRYLRLKIESSLSILLQFLRLCSSQVRLQRPRYRSSWKARGHWPGLLNVFFVSEGPSRKHMFHISCTISLHRLLIGPSISFILSFFNIFIAINWSPDTLSWIALNTSHSLLLGTTRCTSPISRCYNRHGLRVSVPNTNAYTSALRWWPTLWPVRSPWPPDRIRR